MTPPANVDHPGDVRPGAGYVSVPESFWNSRTQWGAIAAGAFAGFAVFLLMSTLGIALGITAGAVSVNTAETVNADTAEKAGTAFSIGTAVWVLLTALATGLTGGWVLNQCSRRDRAYSSFIFGGVTWALGTCLALLLAAPGVGGMFSGLGGGAGGAAGALGSRSDFMRMTPPARQDQGAMQRSETGRESRQNQPLTDEEKAAAKDAADKATAFAAAAAWVMLGSQLISIAATMFAAGWRRHTGARVVTEVRPRPLPTA